MRLIMFLKMVRAATWRSVPPNWNEELRQALSDDLVTTGWGGVLKLTDAGKRMVLTSTEREP